ncbi:MAG: RagB/SusD family nutrient uptake outer membrane protein [Bacteroidales bacterium]|nr:RagB/SusD family nutrient uptake outer membrane protein [Bacteroidales bacterium]
MKRFLKISLAAVAALSLSSCGALDIQNENGLSTGMFWKSQDDINSGLNAVYGMFYRQGTWTRNIYTQLNGMADDGVSYAGWTELNEWTKFNYTNYNFAEGQTKMWREHWTAVNRANQVLDNIDNPEITYDSEEYKLDLKAQALWLRSFYYFYMVALWDNVPLILHTSSAADKPANSKNPEDQVNIVFTQIEEDLSWAAEHLPLTREKEVARPTRGAAYGLLAKVYMQHKKWDKAAECLEWIVDGEGKSLYSLQKNWADNFSNKTEDNSESLYEIQFSLCNYVGFDQTDNYLDANAQLGTQIEVNQSPKGTGWNNVEANRWVVEYFKREKTTEGKNDPRLYYTCWYAEAEADFPEFPDHLIYQKKWSDYKYSTYDNKRVFIKKYSTDAYPLYYWNDNNFRSLRLADMLLLYAECINEMEKGPTAKAVQCLDAVRTRVGLPAIASSTYYDGSKITSDYDAFKEHIKIERALELAFECVRWIDLKRWGFTEETVAEMASRDEDYTHFVLGRHERLPLPQKDCDNNPELNQNPNY